MNTKIFISLPVTDVARSRSFYETLGYAENPDFSGDDTAGFIITDQIQVMMTTHAKFLQLSPKPICDPKKFTQVLLCLSLDSRQQVDDMVKKALAAGGTTFEAAEDHGFMYSHSFIDPDGHGWGLVHMTNPPPK